MNKSRRALKVTVVLISLLTGSLAFAEVKTIPATGEYRMGDNDTRTDAKRMALLDAKRLALEQAGIYLESVTEVKSLQVSHDELRAYTAGIIEVVEQATKDVMEGATHIVRVKVMAKIDTAVVARQIDVLRKNETVKAELLRSQQEADRLRQERDALQQKLSSLKLETEIETLLKKRHAVLTGEYVNTVISQAWAAMAEVTGRRFLEGSSSQEGRVRARSLISQALALDASSPEAHLLLAVLLAEEGKVEEAMAENRTAVLLAPAYASARNNLGVLLHDGGDLHGAIDEYRAALSLEPDNVSAHYNLGIALKASGDFNGAIAEYREALAHEPNSIEIHYNLGLALYAAEDFDRSIAEFRTVLRLRSDVAGAYYQVGLAYDAKGERYETVRAFREYLRLAPQDPRKQNLIEWAQKRVRELEQ